jgi:hypothetical protein
MRWDYLLLLFLHKLGVPAGALLLARASLLYRLPIYFIYVIKIQIFDY